MKKRTLLLIVLAAILSLSCIGFVACGRDDDKGTEYTVTYVDITDENKTLKTEKVAEGGKATEWEPVKEGYTFVEWYATPDMIHVFDFNNAITQDTTVYGYFAEDIFEEDTRSFYILGSSDEGSSVLFNTAWKVKDEAKQKLTKSDKTGVNEYSITVDLYLGDLFQFAINSEFQNQRGFGYIVDPGEYMTESKNYLNPNERVSNIAVAQPGNYTLTLITHPWSDLYDTENSAYTEANKENYNYNVEDTITVVRNGDPTVAPSTEPLTIHVKGSYITGWNHDTSEEYTMTYDAEKDVYIYSHEFVSGDSFMFYNFLEVDGQVTGLGSVNINSSCVDTEKSDVEHLDLTGGNIGTKDNGTYSFEYDRNTNKVIVTYDETYTGSYVPGDTWYVAGSGITEPLKSSSFGNNLTDAQKFTKGEDAHTFVMTLDLAPGDMFQVVANKNYAMAHSYSDIVEPGEGKDATFTLAGDNIRVEKAGNYTLTLTLDPVSPVGDTITWVRNGDIVQELPVAFDVFMKKSPETGTEWTISDRHSTGTDGMAEGVVEFRTYFSVDQKFCFIYYDPGVPDEEVGSHNNPGMLITGLMKGTAGQYNANFGVEENDFLCNVAGFYVIRVDFTSGAPIVDFVEYQENVPEFEAIIKGNALEVGWDGSEKVQSSEAKVEMIVEFIKTGAENLSDGQFGFAWWDESTTTSHGNWIGVANIGTKGNANSLFVSADDANNFVASVTGTYKVVIDMSTGTPVVDFYEPDWQVIIKGTAFDVGWSGSDRLPVFGNRFELEYEFIEGGEFGLTVYGEGADPKYGDYIGWAYLGTSGDANEFFSQQAGGGNNIICNKGGTYKIVIDFSGDEYVLDFYLVA